MLNGLISSSITDELNCLESVIIRNRTPCSDTQLHMRALATLGAVISIKGTIVDHLLIQSINVRQFRKPFEDDNRPTISMTFAF